MTGMVNTFQSMMEQRGFGKTILKKGKISFKDTTGIKDTVRKKAGVVLHETNKIMGEAELERFIMYFERVTRNSLGVLPGVADVVVELGDGHRICGIKVR